MHSTAELYKYLLDIRVWGFNNNDPGVAWNRRRYAQEAATALSESTQKLLARHRADKLPVAFVDKLKSILPWQEADKAPGLKHGSLRWYGSYLASELLDAGKTIKEVSDILWLTALAGVAVPVSVVCVLCNDISLWPNLADNNFSVCRGSPVFPYRREPRALEQDPKSGQRQ